ncbi:MAG: hypothetical protein K2K68_01450 [Duncaniella sp.]|nr:hypothetical protein [Duncaniella sp.]MDE6581111.1 hypothetical protein [Duncaniella sp.]
MKSYVKSLLVAILWMTAFTAYGRYENVSLGTVSWSGDTDWASSSQPFSNSYIEAQLIEKAKRIYPGYSNYSVSIIQNNKQHESKDAPYTRTGDAFLDGMNAGKLLFRYRHNATGQVYAQKWVEDPQPVFIPAAPTPTPEPVSSKETSFEEALSKATDKALEEVPSGSRIAFNKISTPQGISKSEVKDQILESLIDNNFKVVAKEYFDTIKDELEDQRGGQYSERTKVKDNNLSASGYLLDCKIDSSIIRIYIVNVSTGEYTSTSKVSYK